MFITRNNSLNRVLKDSASPACPGLPPGLYRSINSEKVSEDNSPTSVANMQNSVRVMNRAMRKSSTFHLRNSLAIVPNSLAASSVICSVVFSWSKFVWVFP